MSDEMQEYMLSHSLAITTAEKALESYMEWIGKKVWSDIFEALCFNTYWENNHD